MPGIEIYRSITSVAPSLLPRRCPLTPLPLPLFSDQSNAPHFPRPGVVVRSGLLLSDGGPQERARAAIPEASSRRHPVPMKGPHSATVQIVGQRGAFPLLI